MIEVPPLTWIPLVAVLPDGVEHWPGHPSWAPAHPEHMVVTVISADHKQAAVMLLETPEGDPDEPHVIEVVCNELSGRSEELHLNREVASPSMAIEVRLR